MLLESSTLVSDVLVEKWHVVKRLHMEVLVVRDNEQEIRFLVRSIRGGCKAREGNPYQCPNDLHA